VRAIRGAIDVETNTPEGITAATQALIRAIADRNQLRPADVISMFFTLTPDLNASFPARAAREIGWDVPMLDMQEISVPGALPCCLRVLIHARGTEPLRHLYLGAAQALRPDLEES